MPTPPHVTLRGLRRRLGYTLEQIAQRSGVSRATLSAIETGERGASRETLVALTFALDLEPGALTTDYEPRLRRTPGPRIERI
ncbi:helix-turn-helix domain-containing protein [Arcanobacterium canis]